MWAIVFLLRRSNSSFVGTRVIHCLRGANGFVFRFARRRRHECTLTRFDGVKGNDS